MEIVLTTGFSSLLALGSHDWDHKLVVQGLEFQVMVSSSF